MSAVPHELIEVMEDLDASITRYGYQCTNAVDESNKALLSYQEGLSRNKACAYQYSEEVEEKEEKEAQLMVRKKKLSHDLQATQNDVKKGLADTLKTLQELRHLLQSWEDAEEAAHVWVNRAINQLNAAKNKEKSCFQNHQRAVINSANARIQVDACFQHARATKQTPFCGSAQGQSSFCQAEEQTCFRLLNEAREEVKQCASNLRDARNRLSLCEENVETALKGKKEATKAVERAEYADSCLKEAQTFDKQAIKKLDEIKLCTNQQKTCVDEVQQLLAHATFNVDNASMNYQASHQKQCVYEELMAAGTHQVEKLITLLQDFDHAGNIDG